MALVGKALRMLPPASKPMREPLAFKLPLLKRASTVARDKSVPADNKMLPPLLAMREVACMVKAPAAAQVE